MTMFMEFKFRYYNALIKIFCNHCNLSKDFIVINNGLFCNNNTAYKINLKSK